MRLSDVALFYLARILRVAASICTFSPSLNPREVCRLLEWRGGVGRAAALNDGTRPLSLHLRFMQHMPLAPAFATAGTTTM